MVSYLRGRKPALALMGAAGLAIGLIAVGAASSGAVQAQNERAAPPPYAREAIADPAFFRAPHRIDYDLIDQRLQQLIAKPDMVGMGIAIIENGEIAFVKGYGVTQAKGGSPVGVRTVFRWASLSKGVAGTLISELAAEGRLSLDAPIARYAPSLRLPGGGEQVATVANILSHRVGLWHNAYDDRLEAGQDPRVIRGSLGSLKSMCAPGTCHSYQNVAFDSASEVVETVTGRRYEDVVRDKLFRPLGMADASVSRAGLFASPSWARPHVGRTTVTVDDAYYRIPAAGGVNSSIFDMALWMKAQMGLTGNVLRQEVLDTAHLALVGTDRRRGDFARTMGPSRYALGWRDYDFMGHQLVGHQGAVKGYRSTILFDPRTRAGVAVLWNSQSNAPVGIQLEILDMLYGLDRKDWMKLETGVGGHAATVAAR